MATVTVTYMDGTTTTAKILNPDRVRYDLHRHRAGWPDFKEAPFLGLTFWAWAALKRTQGTDLDFEVWAETVADLESADTTEGMAMENPTREAPGLDT